MIEYINGDVTKTNAEFILHGCNAQGVMGSGVAAAIRKNFPDAYKVYKQQEKDFGLKGGQFSVSYATKPAIVNLITQEFFGSDGKKYANQYFIDSSFRNFLRTLPRIRGFRTFAIPKIGCGLGGLDWENDVVGIFENILNDYRGNKIKVYEI